MKNRFGRHSAVRFLTVIATLAVAALGGQPASAATSANATSPLGINLTYMAYYSPEQPFLNIFKTTGITQSSPSQWSTRDSSMNETNEESYLQLDSNGYPTSLKAGAGDPNSPQKFTQVCAIILEGLPNSNDGTGPPYRAGQYVALYDGSGTLAFRNDAQPVSSAAGRDVFNVATPSTSGVWVCITATDLTSSGNYLRNIRVAAAADEAALDAGGVYRPGFLDLLSRFKVIRAMQWLRIDENPTPPGDWADRSQLSDAGWGSWKGVPLDAVIDLCNALSADCWLNVPHTATDDYITQMATLAHNTLGNTQKVYVEFSNETWNTTYPQYAYGVAQGKALWPSAGATDYTYDRDWFGMRTAQTCDIWKSVWGADASRVVCVLGAQSASPWTATEALNCPLWTGAGNAPCYKHNISAVAITSYFGFSPASSIAWTSASDGGLSDLFAELNVGGELTGTGSGDYAGGWLKEASDWEAAYKTALAPFGLPFIAYEGGQGLQGIPVAGDGSPLVNLYIAANRDPRMGAAYAVAMNDWKSNGGEVNVLYDDIYAPSEYGEWGALESFMDTVTPLSSAPPKWQAIQNFISANPCWWNGCQGQVASAPLAPGDFHKAQ